MKKYLVVCVLMLWAISLIAQNDAGKVSISAVQPTYEHIPEEARTNLETKMQRLITSSGLASSISDRFIMTSRIDITTKEVNTSGMIVQRMEITLIIGDVIEEKIYRTTTINALGIGKSETKSFINAFKAIRPNDQRLVDFVNKAKDDIVLYYLDNCPIIIQEAERLLGMQQFEQAIATLVSVPAVCEECYTTCQTKAIDIYNKKINLEGNKLIQEARSVWLVRRDYDCAAKALDLLEKVNPMAQCQSDASKLIDEINTQLRRIEAAQAAVAKARWEFKLKQYEDKMELERKKQNDNAEIGKIFANRFGRIDISYKKEKASKFGS